MSKKITIICMLAMMAMMPLSISAQSATQQPRRAKDNKYLKADSIDNARRADSMALQRKAASIDNAAPLTADSLHLSAADSIKMVKPKEKRDWTTWRPNVKRALWLAIILPGGGQIYNRKYWKLPIIYGGFVGCAYALTWNNQQYHDYAQAYIDIMSDDPNAQSYKNFLHFGAKIDASNKAHYQEVFRKRKDKFRRWRDMSMFAMIGVYALSIIDAYVDASLSEFDISRELSMRVEPAVVGSSMYRNPAKGNGLGLQCSINF